MIHNNYVVHPKVHPQLVRKRTVVKTNPSATVKIIVKPSQGKAANLNDYNNHTKIQVQQLTKQKPQAPAGAAVSKQRFLNKKVTKKAPKEKYISRDVSQDSILKIKKLRNSGTGKILVIIGNGPSINEAPLEQLKHNQYIHTLSINKPDARLWPTTHWAFFDQSQMRRHEDLWGSYSGTIINSTSIKRQKENSLQIKNIGGRGFSRDLVKGLHIGRSSVFAAMQFGYWLNYAHIYIFGVDMNPTGLNGQLHFYGVNPDVNPDIRRERFKKESEYYDYAAEILNEDERKRYTFCSSENPWDFVNRFNKLDHKTAIQHILSHVEKLRAEN